MVAEAVDAVFLHRLGVGRFVAERDGAVIGSNFMDERSTVYGIGLDYSF